MTYKCDLLPVGSRCRPSVRLKTINSITIHWIGPYPKQRVEDPRSWWLLGTDGNGIEASAHFIVKDDTVLECIPVTEIAYHAGCNPGNFSSIGIEVIPMNIEGEFSEQSINTLGLLIDTLPHVPLVRHFDWTKKDCPRWYTPLVFDGEERWIQLKQQILSKRP